jgi:hypothetical protein
MHGSRQIAALLSTSEGHRPSRTLDFALRGARSWPAAGGKGEGLAAPAFHASGSPGPASGADPSRTRGDAGRNAGLRRALPPDFHGRNPVEKRRWSEQSAVVIDKPSIHHGACFHLTTRWQLQRTSGLRSGIKYDALCHSIGHRARGGGGRTGPGSRQKGALMGGHRPPRRQGTDAWRLVCRRPP